MYLPLPHYQNPIYSILKIIEKKEFKMAKLTLFILDGFGIGAMDDCKETAPQDLPAHTYRNLRSVKPLDIPVLYELGLARLVDGTGTPPYAYGKSKLAHFGADTFMGHQELMGSKPMHPAKRLMRDVGAGFRQALTEAGYKVTDPVPGASVLLVDGAVVIGDNLESELGNIINVVCDLNQISFEDAVTIGKVIRKHVDTSRVIVYGNKKSPLEAILSAIKEKNPGQWGVDSPQAGVYGEGYRVMHLGHGVKVEAQFPYHAEQNGLPVYRIGKTADVINAAGYADPVVNTTEVLEHYQTMYNSVTGDAVFLVNVQETDLAGHAQDTDWYKAVLEEADKFLERFIPTLGPEDIMIITADHGNDPTVGHSNHTREHTPIFIVGPRVRRHISIGTRETMADIGATMSEFFNVPAPEHGESFLPLILNGAERSGSNV
jgi:phosphopentomutase